MHLIFSKSKYHFSCFPQISIYDIFTLSRSNYFLTLRTISHGLADYLEMGYGAFKVVCLKYSNLVEFK